MMQRRTAWWATRHTFPCRSSSIITGSSLQQDDMEEEKEKEDIEEDKEQEAMEDDKAKKNINDDKEKEDIKEPGYGLQEQEKSRSRSARGH